MSIHWADWVWENGPGNVQDNLVLLRLAYRADQDGFCFPSIADVVKGTRLSERAVCRSISNLQRDGWMEILKGGGRGKTSQYHLIKRVPNSQSLETTERVTASQGLDHKTLPISQSNESAETLTNSLETLTNRQNPLHPLNGVKVKKGQVGSQPPSPELPEWLHRDSWEGFVEMRRKIPRVPFTDRARSNILSDLEKLHSYGIDPNQRLEKAISSGWRGVLFPEDQPAHLNGAPKPKTQYDLDIERQRALRNEQLKERHQP
jgi:hypothetical protein